MVRRMLAGTAVIAALLFATTSARATLLIEIGSASINAGESVFIPVYISSPEPNGQDLDISSVTFVLTSESGSATLGFDAAQDESFMLDPEYVYAGNSFNVANAAPYFLSVDTSEALGGDGLADTETPLTVTTPKLLAILKLTAPGNSLSGVISVGLLTVGGIVAQTPSVFLDSSGNEIPYEVLPGTVTVTGIIPEPSSVVLMGLGVVGLIGYGWRRRKA